MTETGSSKTGMTEAPGSIEAGLNRWSHTLKGGLQVLIAAALSTAMVALPVAAQKALNRIVAVVEDEAITELELSQNISRAARMLKQQKRELPDERTLAGQVLQQMIMRQLQLQEAKKHNIVIDEIALDRAVTDIAGRQGLTLADFERMFADNPDESYLEFRQRIRDELTIQRLIQLEVIQQIQASEEEIQAALAASAPGRESARYHFARIQVVPQSPDAAASAKKHLVRIRRQLIEETDSLSSFASLQKRFSQLWQAKAGKDAKEALTRTRDMGWRYIEELPGPISRRIDSLRSDGFSPVISSKNGLYLFQLLASRESGHTIMERQYRVRHILIPTSPVDNDAQVRRKLAGIKRKLENGADFAEFACAYSHDPLSSIRDGDLGWSNLKAYAPEFAAAARRSYETGDIVGPFKTTFGWHILEVTDSREQSATDDTPRQQAIVKIKKDKTEESIRLWLLGLREKSRIEIRI